MIYLRTQGASYPDVEIVDVCIPGRDYEPFELVEISLGVWEVLFSITIIFSSPFEEENSPRP